MNETTQTIIHLSDAHKQKISNSKKGKKFTDEHKQHLSNARKGKCVGEDSPNYGKHWYTNGEIEIYTTVAPAGFTQGRIQRKPTHEERRKISESIKGRHLTDEHKRKIGEAHKGKTVSNNTKKKMSESRKGLKWWNDGKVEIRAVECPNGFVEGRLKYMPPVIPPPPLSIPSNSFGFEVLSEVNTIMAKYRPATS